MKTAKRVRKKRTRRTPEQQEKHTKDIIDKFNAEHPIGKVVWYWSTLPFGPVKETKIWDSAWALPSDEIVCKVDGIAGGVSIFHITDVDESRRDIMNIEKLDI